MFLGKYFYKLFSPPGLPWLCNKKAVLEKSVGF